MSRLDVDCYLVIGQKVSQYGTASGRPRLRLAILKPSLKADEVAIAIALTLPLSLFSKPTLSASIVVNGDQAPEVITPEIQHDIAEVLRERHGITLRIEAPEGPAT